jgi:hypothetical protein
MGVTGTGTTADPYNVAYTGPRVLYKYVALITSYADPGNPLGPPTQLETLEIYDSIPGGVGDWTYGGCPGYFYNDTLKPAFQASRFTTVVQVTPAGSDSAGQAMSGGYDVVSGQSSFELGVSSGGNLTFPPPLGLDACPQNGTNYFSAFFEVTVYDTNPQP